VKDDVNGGVSAAVSVTVGPFGTIVPAPNTLRFSDVGAGAAKTFTATESNYSGTLTLDVSSCPSTVATVSPSSGPSGTTFTLTPVGSGSCTINVTDDHTQSSAVTATVATFGAISPLPTSLTFTDIPPQTFTVSESGYTGQFTVDQSACSGIATVAPLSGTSSTTFTVTPSNTSASGGTCNLHINDDHASTTANLGVTFGPFGALSPSPTSLAFTTGGGSKTFTVNESVYSGSFTIDATKCSGPGFATESPSSGANGATFTVTAGSVVGNCAIKITDDHGGQSSVVVSVTAGTLTVTPISLSFTGPGAPSQTFTASDTGSATIFSASSSDATIATVLPPTQPGPGPVTFTVTPSATNTGTATITVTDDVGGTAAVSVGVGVSPLVKKRHPIAVHQPLHAPAPKPTPGPGVHPPIRVPVGPIGPRRITVDGGGGIREQVSPPTPTPTASPVIPRPTPLPMPSTSPFASALTASVANVTLRTDAGPQTFIVSEPGYTRAFTVSTSNAAIASMSVAGGSGPMLTVAIVPHSAGVALIRIADDHGGIRVITVIVRAGALPVSHPPRPGAP